MACRKGTFIITIHLGDTPCYDLAYSIMNSFLYILWIWLPFHLESLTEKSSQIMSPSPDIIPLHESSPWVIIGRYKKSKDNLHHEWNFSGVPNYQPSVYVILGSGCHFGLNFFITRVFFFVVSLYTLHQVSFRPPQRNFLGKILPGVCMRKTDSGHMLWQVSIINQCHVIVCPTLKWFWVKWIYLWQRAGSHHCLYVQIPNSEMEKMRFTTFVPGVV